MLAGSPAELAGLVEPAAVAAVVAAAGWLPAPQIGSHQLPWTATAWSPIAEGPGRRRNMAEGNHLSVKLKVLQNQDCRINLLE